MDVLTSIKQASGKALRRVIHATKPLRRIWFTAFVSALLVIVMLFPSLASEQIREALITYPRNQGPTWANFPWMIAGLTLIAIFLLSLVLRFWTARLFGFNKDTLTKINQQQHRWLLLVWAGPWVALGLTYLGIICLTDLAWRGSFVILLLLTIAIPVICYFRFPAGFIDTSKVIQAVSLWGPLTLFLLGVVCFSLLGPALPRVIGPIALLAFALSALGALGSVLILAGRRTRLPLFWIAASYPLLLGAFDLNDNHPIRIVDGGSEQQLLTVTNALAHWSALRGSADAGAPIVIVSAEGGGIRAAYFTALTLARIADRCPAAANRIFAISSVSGGSIGAAVYAAAVHARPIDVADTRCDFDAASPGWYEERIDGVFRRDHLSPILSRYLYPDALARFVPVPINAFDRQRGLERSFEEAFTDEFHEDLLSQSYFEVTPNAEHRSTPYLFLNTTSVERGTRVVASAVELLEADFTGARSFDRAYHFRLSAIAGTSARFPYLSPSGYVHRTVGITLPNGRGANEIVKERYVDGGYFDNSGATTALEIYQTLVDARGYEPNLRAFQNAPVILLHIGNQPVCDSGDELSARSRACRPQRPAGGLDELVGPLRAVLAARNSRVDYTLEQLDDTRDHAAGHELHLLRIQMVDTDIPVPLGWFLSPRAADEMRRQLARDPRVNCDSTLGYENFCTLLELGDHVTRER